MRARTLLLIIAVVVVGYLALLNWNELTRPTTLDLGWQTTQAPLGMVLLGLLAVSLLAFLISSASNHTRRLMEERQHTKALQAQRDLADKAEASRFTDLRQMLESHLRETRQREVNGAGEFDKSLSQVQREMRTQLEQMHRSMSMRLGEMEARLEARLDRTDHVRSAPVVRDTVVEPVRGVEARHGEPVATSADPLEPRPYTRSPNERV